MTIFFPSDTKIFSSPCQMPKTQDSKKYLISMQPNTENKSFFWGWVGVGIYFCIWSAIWSKNAEIEVLFKDIITFFGSNT